MDTYHRMMGDILASICPPGTPNAAQKVLADLDSVLASAEEIQRAIRERNEAQQKILRMLRACFNKAAKDEAARIPEYLSAAIINACAMVRE